MVILSRVRRSATAAALILTTGLCMAAEPSNLPAAGAVMPVDSAVHTGRLGLFAASDFRLSTGNCKDCGALPQALWYFRDQVIAVPQPGLPVAGFSRDTIHDDVAAWAAAGAPAAYPGLVWLGGPDRIASAIIAADGKSLALPDGSTLALRLAPRLASNRSYFNAASLATFAGRPVSLRGTLRPEGDKLGFVAETIWPADFTLAAQAPDPLGKDDTLRAFVQANGGGARMPYASRVLWQRRGMSAAGWEGKPALAMILSGAQGDDDESLGGHFAVATGTVGAHGEWGDWLANNFYPLDSVSEKGLIAATMPLDKYLADLNGGQQYYRPSYALVAILARDAAARQYQGGVQRLLNHYYRHDILYDNATANCTGLSMDVFTGLGWNIPRRGATHAVKALFAYPYQAIRDGSLASGRKAYDYLSEEQTRLYPAVAFEAAGEDLLKLMKGETGRPLAAYEQVLQNDVQALVLVRLPQFPSSRAYGSAPVFSFDEYMERVPKNRADWKVIPVPPRPFPPALKDGLALNVHPASVLPLRVAIAAAFVAAIIVLLVLLLARRR
jgi:hypothetical protein